MSTNPKVDAYIENAADFAKPILKHLRQLIHKACPDVEETWKWSFPNFDHKGIFCSMAAFKNHCAFNFWKASLMSDPEGILHVKDKNAMGNFDKITSLKDLPSDKIMLAYLKEAVKLNEENIKKPIKPKAASTQVVETPQILLTALQKNKKAHEAFAAFSASHKKEYIEWILEAKTEATQNKRVETAVEWMAEGKHRNWKYEKK